MMCQLLMKSLSMKGLTDLRQDTMEVGSPKEVAPWWEIIFYRKALKDVGSTSIKSMNMEYKIGENMRKKISQQIQIFYCHNIMSGNVVECCLT